MKVRTTIKALKEHCELIDISHSIELKDVLPADYYHAGVYGWNFDAFCHFYKHKFYAFVYGLRTPKCKKLTYKQCVNYDELAKTMPLYDLLCKIVDEIGA